MRKMKRVVFLLAAIAACVLCLCAFGSPEPGGFTPTMGCELAAFLARVVERMAERWPVLN